MGGHAIASAQRIPGPVYENLVNRIDNFHPNGNKSSAFCVIPKSLKKESHGDLDIICQERYRGDVVSHLASIGTLDITNKVTNGDVTSYPFTVHGQTYQLDLQSVSSEKKMHQLYRWQSWNDLPMILGRMIRGIIPRDHELNKVGIQAKYRPDGVWVHFGKREECVLKLDNYTDFYLLVSLLGLTNVPWVYGFKNDQGDFDERVMFDWVLQSKYFESRAFLNSEMNHPTVLRNQKRPMFLRFQELVLREHPNRTAPDVWYLREQIMRAGTELWKEEQERRAKNDELKKHFSGHLVLELLASNGRQLPDEEFGKLMAKLRTTYSYEYLVQVGPENFESEWRTQIGWMFERGEI